MNTIAIALSAPYSEQNLHQALQSSWNTIEDALDTEVREFDTHAQFEYATLSAVNLTDNQLSITYQVHYHVYHPCRGLDVRDHCTRQIRAQLTNNTLVLAIHQAWPERSTADEL